VLSLPLAFILSQDQTLHRILFSLATYLLFDSNSSGLFSNLPILLLLFLLFQSFDRNGCQFNMSRNVFFFVFRLSFVSQSGCKSSNFFLTGKNFLNFFRKIFFRPFFIFLSSISRNVTRFAGCKSNSRF
jgi:hypothetical protein